MTDPIRKDLLDSLAKPPPPPSELDELMARDPITLTRDDIDKLIAYQRKARALREAGAKRGRQKAEPPPPGSIDLSAMVLNMVNKPAPMPAPTGPKPARRF